MTTRYQDAPSCQIEGLADLYLDRFGWRTDGTFVEVGAFDGLHWSNTWGLAQAGWNGLLVEPQPEMFTKLETLYAGNPRITLERCCIGAEDGEATLYVGGSLSTTRPEMVALYRDLPWSRSTGLADGRSLVCPVTTLDALLERCCWAEGFEVMVIDVEGAEEDVLAGFDVDRWRPSMAIIETHEEYPDERLAAKAGPIGDYFAAAGYAKLQADAINTIYWRASD